MKWYWYLIIFIGLLIIIYGIILFKLFNYLLKWGRKDFKDLDDLDHLLDEYKPYKSIFIEGKEYVHSHKYSEFKVPTRDGLNMHCYYFENDPNSKNIAIFVHGYHSNSLFVHSRYLKFYEDLHINCFLFDLRAHFNSEGTYTTMGKLERDDLHVIVEYVSNKFGKDANIILHGMSMGASIVLYSLDTPYKENVRALVIDGAYDQCKTMLKYQAMHKFNVNVPITRFFLGVLGKIVYKIDVYEKTEKYLATNKIPTAIFHTINDDMVPYKCAVDNHKSNAAEINDLYTYEDGKHTYIFLKYREDAQKKLAEFYRKVGIIE